MSIHFRFRAIRRALALCLLSPALLFAGTATSGRWLVDFNPDGTLELTLKRRSEGSGHWNWSSSSNYQLRDFQGLARPSGAGDVAVTFQMVRDAGTVAFEGQLDPAGGSGRFTFTANPEYLAALKSMGYATPDADETFSLTVHDVSRTFIRELDALGYRKVPLDDLLSLRIHDAGPEFIRELKALGYTGLSTDDLVSMSIHERDARVHPGAQGPRLRPALCRRARVHAHPRRHPGTSSGSSRRSGYSNSRRGRARLDGHPRRHARVRPGPEGPRLLGPDARRARLDAHPRRHARVHPRPAGARLPGRLRRRPRLDAHPRRDARLRPEDEGPAQERLGRRPRLDEDPRKAARSGGPAVRNRTVRSRSRPRRLSPSAFDACVFK